MAVFCVGEKLYGEVTAQWYSMCDSEELHCSDLCRFSAFYTFDLQLESLYPSESELEGESIVSYFVVIFIMLFLFLPHVSSIAMCAGSDSFQSQTHTLDFFARPPFVLHWLWILIYLPLWPCCGPSRPHIGPLWSLMAPLPLLVSLSFIPLPPAHQMFIHNAADKEKSFPFPQSLICTQRESRAEGHSYHLPF